MKTTITVEREVDIRYCKLSVAVRYGDDDIPSDFPLRKGDLWEAVIDIDQGKIGNWPEGHSGRVNMKVTDQGTYHLLEEDLTRVASLENDYVPNNLIPGEYGDYIDLHINESGIITNWPKVPNFSDFFEE